ncbi:Esterase lipase [Mycena indigotica]|uniref:Esterase lipase n=1 Tax=Mycena indigotica TaxID=2126181 RepID=A0A8H6W0L9_9AGAR|nr:Esterase lipase [Mycena indigotica]KAF7295014.1 Esterase lipase [Mycena indigotica]
MGEPGARKVFLCRLNSGRPILLSDDKSAHRAFATKLVEATQCRVIVPNYRLTPQVITPETKFEHPGHAEDILAFLTFLPTWAELGGVSDKSVHLLGHSAGAHILASILLDSSAVTPSLMPSPIVTKMVHGVILSEGIYDIELLLERFPSYRQWFIAAAFGERDSYADVSVLKYPSRNQLEGLRWLIVHSTGDTLVDIPQSQNMATHLTTLYGDSNVEAVFNVFSVEHDDVLLEPSFSSLVRKFLNQ